MSLSGEDIDTAALAERFREVYLRSHRIMDRMMRAEGLSLARMKLLIFIKNEGSVRSADIAQGFGFAPRTVTEAIDALEREGLVAREADPTDRRAKRVTLTATGEAMVAAARPAHARLGDAAFGMLDADERRTLASLLDRMTARLEALETP